MFLSVSTQTLNCLRLNGRVFTAVRSNRVLAGPGLTSFFAMYALVTQRE